MDNIKVHRMPLPRLLIELRQPVLPQHLCNVTPRKDFFEVVRPDLEEQRVVLISRFLDECLRQQARRGLLSNRRLRCCEHCEDRYGVGFPVADRDREG